MCYFNNLYFLWQQNGRQTSKFLAGGISESFICKREHTLGISDLSCTGRCKKQTTVNVIVSRGCQIDYSLQRTYYKQKVKVKFTTTSQNSKITRVPFLILFSSSSRKVRKSLSQCYSFKWLMHLRESSENLGNYI